MATGWLQFLDLCVSLQCFCYSHFNNAVKNTPVVTPIDVLMCVEYVQDVV